MGGHRRVYNDGTILSRVSYWGRVRDPALWRSVFATRLRFAAVARTPKRSASVEAGHHTVDGKLLQKPAMNGLHRVTGENSATDIRLIGDNDELVPG